MSTKQIRIYNKEPCLIQRCTLGQNDKKLYYENMGSMEFEVGYQVQSLKRILEGKIETGTCTVQAFDREIKFYLVARSGFPFSEYAPVIDGLIKLKWRMQEPTYLDCVLKKTLKLVDKKKYSFIKTEVWLDFSSNDVLFTLSQKDADRIIVALANTKEIWRQKDVWLNSLPVKKFREELEKIKTRLQKAGKHWFSLEDIQETDDKELKVWLNPMEQNIYTHYWCTLQDLRDWLKNKGPIMKEQNKSERIGK